MDKDILERRDVNTDKDILEQLYRSHYAPAYAYCLTLCGREMLAQDIVADAFVKACLNLPDNIPSFRYWLLRVCRNLWLDHLRREKHLSGSEALESLTDPHTPENKYIRQEEYRTLWKCIGELPSRDRELLILHYFSQLPLTEIAAMTGLSYAATRQRMVRLRTQLKQRMEEHGYGK